jgi:Conserved TM helix
MVFTSIGGRVTRAFDVFFSWLPHLVGAVVVLVLGYIVAKILGSIVARVLHRAGFDRMLQSGLGGTFVQKLTSSPSRLAGRITFWAVLLGAISLAVSVLGIAALTSFVAAVYAYLPNVLAAFLIFLVAAAIAGAIAALVSRTMGDTTLGKVVASVAPALVMAIAVFMILVQLKIAVAIVTITYAGLIGAIALGSALAFGLGGRSVAERMLEGAYQAGVENKEQMRRDLQLGKERAKEQAAEAKERIASEQPTGQLGSRTLGTDPH